MDNKARRFINAARVPDDFPITTFGNWRLDRVKTTRPCDHMAGFATFVSLRNRIKVEPTMANIHVIDDDGYVWDVVMEDSRSELEKHLPIWMSAKGHVLKTGLGLGCVVRGLMVNDDAEKITVIEIDKDIIDVVGKQFEGDERVEIIHADATKFDYRSIDKIDIAWHDIWTPENEGLQVEHVKMMFLVGCTTPQGAWAMPRFMKRSLANKIPGYIC